MCLNDPKIEGSAISTKVDSDGRGTAPALGTGCGQSLKVIATLLKMFDSGLYGHVFWKMCENDPEKDDFAKVGKHVYDELDVAPTL